jgi:hypothetical protein
LWRKTKRMSKEIKKDYQGKFVTHTNKWPYTLYHVCYTHKQMTLYFISCLLHIQTNDLILYIMFVTHTNKWPYTLYHVCYTHKQMTLYFISCLLHTQTNDLILYIMFVTHTGLKQMTLYFISCLLHTQD